MPDIAIIGRQNVGKSTLFNSLIGSRKSIVFNQPGVTRDIVSHEIPWNDNGVWTLFDFPGFENIDAVKDDLLVEQSIERAIAQLHRFSLLLWVISRFGLTPYEELLHQYLRKINKLYWLVVNFVDDPSLEDACYNFYSLGMDKIFFVSALNHRNIQNMKHAIIKYFPVTNPKETKASPPSLEKTQKPLMRLAIIGKPNTGKSTLFNALLQKDMAMISDVPGTTRDSLDAKLSFHGQKITLVDTAGLRGKKTKYDVIETFSVMRTQENIQKADVVILLINPLEGLDKQNKTLINLVYTYHKPLILGISKSDILLDKPAQREWLEEEIKDLQRIFWKFPVQFNSGLYSRKISSLIHLSVKLFHQSNQAIPTPLINKMFEKVKSNVTFSSLGIKVYYITQANPRWKFIIFSNRAKLPNSTTRFIVRQLSLLLGLQNLPVFIHNRKHNS